MNLVKAWFQRHFSNPEVVILAVVLAALFALVFFLGRILAPILASLILAYLLEGPIKWMEQWRVPRRAGVLVVFGLFVAFLLFILLWLLPIVSRQVVQLVQALPSMLAATQEAMMRLPSRYPEVITEKQVADLLNLVGQELGRWGQNAVGWSVAYVKSLIAVLVYLILMPLLVFFFLKDRDVILGWARRYLPGPESLSARIWREVDVQTSNYVRGKAWEILIVSTVSFATFMVLDLDFALLLAVLVGLSVLVPYIGVAVMYFPITLVAYFQFGFTASFFYVVGAYTVIQLLDGNLLAPLLLSEVVNLHPVAMITAVLLFGGLWGFWGVFFAIPLATLVQAILRAWPQPAGDEAGPQPLPSKNG